MKAYYRVMLGKKSAFAAVPHVSFYRYEIRFKLVKA
jgi:hypothetical protein